MISNNLVLNSGLELSKLDHQDMHENCNLSNEMKLCMLNVLIIFYYFCTIDELDKDFLSFD